MWSGVKIKTEPSEEPVSISELKAQLRLDNSDQDSMLTSLIKAARQAVEAKLHRTLCSTTYIQYHDEFENPIELYRPPATSVTAVTYLDEDDAEQTLDSSNYNLDLNSLPPRIKLADSASWPSISSAPAAVRVEFVAGYGGASDVPEPIRQAILMLAADLYEHSEANVEVTLNENKTLNFLLAAYAVPVVV